MLPNLKDLSVEELKRLHGEIDAKIKTVKPEEYKLNPPSQPKGIPAKNLLDQAELKKNREEIQNEINLRVKKT